MIYREKLTVSLKISKEWWKLLLTLRKDLSYSKDNWCVVNSDRHLYLFATLSTVLTTKYLKMYIIAGYNEFLHWILSDWVFLFTCWDLQCAASDWSTRGMERRHECRNDLKKREENIGFSQLICGQLVLQ